MLGNRGKGLYNIQYKHTIYTIIYTLYVYRYIYRYTAYRHTEVYQVDRHSFRAIRFRHQLPGRGAYERIFPDLNFQVRFGDTGSASGGTTLRNAATGLAMGQGLCS